MMTNSISTSALEYLSLLQSGFMRSIRISIGSADVLGLKNARHDVDPTTCYLMTASKELCQGHCAFCPQGIKADEIQNKKNAEKLSRITWPEFPFEEFISTLKLNQNRSNPRQFKRICIQVLNYPGFIEDVYVIIHAIREINGKLPISAAIPPVQTSELEKLHQLGLERIGIALDAVTPELFYQIKGKGVQGPYTWENHWHTLQAAVKIFGKMRVSTHFIIGMGETEEQSIEQIRNAIQIHVLPGIFMFTPVMYTPMATAPRPNIETFRRVQLARWLLLQNLTHFQRFEFEHGILKLIQNLTHDELRTIIKQGGAFKTAGCPDCNRPYYNSAPNQEQDGFPRDLTTEEQNRIFEELKNLIPNP